MVPGGDSPGGVNVYILCYIYCESIQTGCLRSYLMECPLFILIICKPNIFEIKGELNIFSVLLFQGVVLAVS